MRIQSQLESVQHKIVRTEEPLSLSALKRGNFDYAISYRYRYIIKQEIIEYFQGRVINLHISLLPWNKGSDPNLWSFLENTPKGVTIHRINEKLDSGSILVQKEIFFTDPAETLATTYAQLSKNLESLFIEHMSALLSDQIVPIQQSQGGSYHKSSDKLPYLHLIEKKGWNTPINEITGAACHCTTFSNFLNDII